MSYSTCGTVDEHRLAFERHWAMQHRLKRVRFIVTQFNQELPGGEASHGRPGRVHVVNASRLQCEMGRWRGDVLRIGTALTEAGKSNHAEDLIADREILNVIGDDLDNPGHIGAWNDGQRNRWSPFEEATSCTPRANTSRGD